MKTWWIVAALAVVGGLAAGAVWYLTRDDGLPSGFASANGRIEVERVDIAAKFAGRVAELLVAEGDYVEAGAVVARMDDAQILARLNEAEAGLGQARQLFAEAEAILASRESERTFARQELERAETLHARGFAPGEELDRRQSQAGVERARAAIVAAEAGVARLRADLRDYELSAPRPGRIQYVLARSGEVVPAGGRVVTLLDLTDAYMTVFLPAAAAGQLRFGAEARLVFDPAPQFVVPARVTFVATDAQFTPKFVETEEQRSDLMLRVKVSIPEDLLSANRDLVKSGIRGVATLRLDPGADWPADLAVRLPDGG